MFCLPHFASAPQPFTAAAQQKSATGGPSLSLPPAHTIAWGVALACFAAVALAKWGRLSE